MVDTNSLPMVINVGAAIEADCVDGIDVLADAGDKDFDNLEVVTADGVYKGEFKVIAKWYEWEVQITQKLPDQKGFIVQKNRWQVERSFAWLNFFRRLSKDYERTITSSVAFISLAFISIILNRLPG